MEVLFVFVCVRSVLVVCYLLYIFFLGFFLLRGVRYLSLVLWLFYGDYLCLGFGV